MPLFDSNLPALLAGAGALGAAITGFTGSGHCALMCGPLAGAAVPLGKDGATTGRRRAALSWHVGRFGAYVLLGLALGLAGRGATWALLGGAARVLPWIMAATLVATAFDVGKRLPAIPGLGPLSRQIFRAGDRLPPNLRAGVMGLATPLLPCGFLYGVLVAAIATGSALGGGLVMAAFAFGTAPALALVQAQLGLLQRFPRATRIVRRVVPVLAAAILVWRALGAGTGEPSCHHLAVTDALVEAGR
jgi:sulfite exporter TauE/SafE